MKEKFFKVLRGIMYMVGCLFLIISISTCFDGAPFTSGFLSITFSILMMPIIYKNIEKQVFKYQPKLSKVGFFKFFFSYIILVFIGYFISFGLATDGIAKEKVKIDKNTILEAKFDISNPYTSNEELQITLNQKNIKELSINAKDVKLEGENLTYSIPLNLGQNDIIIVGKNGNIKREFKKSIERVSKDEELKRQQEQQKIIEEENKIKEEERIKQEEIAKQLQIQQEEATKQAQVESEKQRVNTAKERLNKEISDAKNYNGEEYRKTVDLLLLEVAVFSSYSTIIDQYINDTNSEVKGLAIQLKNEVSKLQVREFPKMRKAYGDIVGSVLWASNIDVIIKGNQNGTIELVSGMFANNQNKLDAYNQIKETLGYLRFDRANFKWYKYDDEYTYWDVDSLPDNEIKKGF